MSEINIEEFINVDLRVAKIKEAHEVPDADKLVELILDVGELGEKRVAFGLTQELQNVVSYVGRFNLIEADRDNQLAMLNDLKANQAKIDKAKYWGYVTIYDFAQNLKEEIKGGKVESINETIVGIQVKMVNLENTQYVVGSGQGRASTIGKGFLMNPDMSWNQSSLSSASNKAMETAVVNVIKAIDRKGW